MIRVALVDLGMGNLRSVERAIARAASDAGVACAVDRTGDPGAILRADKIVVPGQGAFRDCSAGLAGGMGAKPLHEVTAKRPPRAAIQGSRIYGRTPSVVGGHSTGVKRG